MRDWGAIDWAIFIVALGWAIAGVIDVARGGSHATGCGCFEPIQVRVTAPPASDAGL